MAFLTTVLVAIDITLAGLFWALAEDRQVIPALIRKVLYVGAFALIINNFQALSGTRNAPPHAVESRRRPVHDWRRRFPWCIFMDKQEEDCVLPNVASAEIMHVATPACGERQDTDRLRTPRLRGRFRQFRRYHCCQGKTSTHNRVD